METLKNIPDQYTQLKPTRAEIIAEIERLDPFYAGLTIRQSDEMLLCFLEKLRTKALPKDRQDSIPAKVDRDLIQHSVDALIQYGDQYKIALQELNERFPVQYEIKTNVIKTYPPVNELSTRLRNLSNAKTGC